MFFEKGALRNFAKFTEKTRASESVFNKIAGLWPATLVKKRLSYRFFAVNFAKFKYQKMVCLAKIVHS